MSNALCGGQANNVVGRYWSSGLFIEQPPGRKMAFVHFMAKTVLFIWPKWVFISTLRPAILKVKGCEGILGPPKQASINCWRETPPFKLPSTPDEIENHLANLIIIIDNLDFEIDNNFNVVRLVKLSILSLLTKLSKSSKLAI